MNVELCVPDGTKLFLLGREIHPNPSGRDEIVWPVAVYSQAVAGRVWMRGHTCTPSGECGGGWCFEAQVSVDAIRSNLAGER